MSRRSWSQADDDLLIALNQQTDPRLPQSVIGERFGVTAQAVNMRYKKLAAIRNLSSKRGHSTCWSNAEDAELERRCDAGEPFDVVGHDLGRTRHACKQRYNTLKRPNTTIAAVKTDPREAALAEAQRLRQAPPVHDSVTAWFCGDPLPGRSALDQKRTEEAVRIKHNRIALHVTLPA